MMKPRVTYIDLAAEPEIGQPARLLTFDHYRPRECRGWIRTSPVEKLMPQATGPVIETKNTIYWPAQTDESNPYPQTESQHDENFSFRTEPVFRYRGRASRDAAVGSEREHR